MSTPTDTEGLSPVPSLDSVSVVIVTYYTGPLLWRSLHAVMNQDGVLDIIVVDNGNWPSTVAHLVDMAALDPRLKIVTGQGNVGFAAGCNLGAKAAEGTDLLLLNPDAIMPTGAITKLRDDGYARAQGDSHWMIGGRLVNPDGSEQAGSRRGPLTPWTALVEMLRLDKLAPRHPYFRRFNQNSDECPNKTVEIPCISGACMLMPLSAFNAIGGMDEKYFLHAEDVDFCLRFAADGGQVMFDPTVDVLHMKSSSRTDRIRVERWKAQSLNRYFRQHFSTQYPFGFVSAVCGLVWAGWTFRASKILLGRVSSLIGFNRRQGVKNMGRAMRTAKRLRDR